jgi:hypothetical protein
VSNEMSSPVEMNTSLVGSPSFRAVCERLGFHTVCRTASNPASAVISHRRQDRRRIHSRQVERVEKNSGNVQK